MAVKLTEKLIEFLTTCEGKEVTTKYLRQELRIDPNSSAWDGIRVYLKRFVEKGIVKPSGKNDGMYKVIKRVDPVRVFIPGRQRRPEFELFFPQDRDKGTELEIAEKFVIREGDLITLGGVKNKGKTTLCLGFLAANLDKRPVLMGNEYTIFTDGKYEPAPRFLNRLDAMKWVNWVDDKGNDKFTLLPIKEDYAEHIVRDRINIIDWINIDANQLYDIGRVLEDIKSHLGKGIAIIALQKSDKSTDPRGGQFARDFSDIMLLLDGYGNDDILMTIGEVKEKRAPISGKTYAYSILNEGTEIYNFREVKKCFKCHGSGYTRGETCDVCDGRKFVDKMV